MKSRVKTYKKAQTLIWALRVFSDTPYCEGPSTLYDDQKSMTLGVHISYVVG